MIRTKVICTLGPAVDDPDVLIKLIEGGMDVVRMNFSHGTHEEHLSRLNVLRELCKQAGTEIPVLLDTKGPEIRLGEFPAGECLLTEGQSYILTSEDAPCDDKKASVSYAGLADDVSSGDMILIDDGLISLEVKSIDGKDIYCTVLNDGKVSSKKGVNVPNVKLGLPSLTEQDKLDILFAIEHDYDFIAVSFVRKKEDISAIQRFLNENGGHGIKLIAKVENQEGVDNIEDIIRISDGIMVARGDLGVEIPVENVPIVQKEMIKMCYRSRKPVITATQMLDSMIRNPRPTRAEVTDVANAIYDGTSTIMLSGETAAGKYPVEAFMTMRSIAQATENSIDYWKRFRNYEMPSSSSITNAISHATCMTAMDINAAAIVAVTTGGRTARNISAFRPDTPIIAAATNKRVFRQLRMSWGVYPYLADTVSSTDELFALSVKAAADSGMVETGDLVVVTAGVPVSTSGTTNMLKVQMIGDILCRGRGLNEKSATGSVCIISRKRNDKGSFERGGILVVDELTDSILPLIRLSSGVILDGMDKEKKGETLALALEIPFLVDADGATQLLKTGTMVEVDAKRGIVKSADDQQI